MTRSAHLSYKEQEEMQSRQKGQLVQRPRGGKRLGCVVTSRKAQGWSTVRERGRGRRWGQRGRDGSGRAVM